MNDWPDWVQRLPIIDTPFPCGCGYLLAGTDGQVVFWSFPTGASVPRHQHGPQLGLVLAGRVELTVGDEERTVCAGEHFSLGDQVPHAAVVAPGTLVIEVFADPERHAPAQRPA
ncbi:cupin domain-containing protein [Nocardia sp. CNY236]|uniref:cupin domain-containing protein n=1 Tax=Nocardia sp. CNY236 TaxID=1169152 RepID=UPI0003F56AEE|nr:cupin domain-containing protein [Nocardia sp. CNY236]